MCKVLILDDEESAREIFSEILEDTGLEIITAPNAITAGVLLEKHPDIRITLCDLFLPGMDGMSFCRKVKAVDPLMVMIAITGYKNLFSLIDCRLAGFDEVLFKPDDVKIIPEILKAAHERIKRWGSTTRTIEGNRGPK